MRLCKLSAKGFRSLKQVELELEPLTVLIGENDAGKSSVLDLIDICLSLKQPDPRDYYQDGDSEPVSEIEAILDFALDASDTDARPFALGDSLRVKYVFRRAGGRELLQWFEAPDDKNLAQDFSRMSPQAQKDLIQRLDSSVSGNDISNGDKRIAWLESYRTAAPKHAEWVQAVSKLGEFLPRFERYSAMEYAAPEGMITKTLKQVFEQTIYDEETLSDGTTRRRLIEPLRSVEMKASSQIQLEVLKLRDYIVKYNKRILDIRYEPKFDFAGSLRTGDFEVNSGRGMHLLVKTGSGTRRRMFMGILDWDRDVSVAQAKAAGKLPSIIRGYDEPDTNLHYGAQRALYQVISDIVHTPNSRIQALLCTHSLTMIDRAPAQSIRLFQLCDEGHTEVSRLQTDCDPEVERFLSEMARELGITNSLIFYERCFVLIEGQTEENALPILYRRLYGRSMLEDGIRVINVSGNGAVKEFLKLLSRNRKQFTVVLVDSDTKLQKAARLTEQILKEAGFDGAFIAERLLYAGSQEFEDAFTDDAIADCLSTYWPKRDGCSWYAAEIKALRSGTKFSDGIKGLVWKCCDEDTSKWSKPDFGRKLAEKGEVVDVPEVVTRVFELARRVAGV